MEIEIARQKYDYNKAAELKYGILQLEKELKIIEKSPKGTKLLKRSNENDIASSFKWTRILCPKFYMVNQPDC